MTDIKAYYFGSFERDLEAVIGTRRPRYFGGTWRAYGCLELGKVAPENRPAFVSCLYYSVLLDQGLYHHAHAVYKKSGLSDDYPKFCLGLGKGHIKPREILRYSVHWGLVSADNLLELAFPAANLFIPEFIDTVTKLLPQVSVPDFFYLLTNFPEVNYWSPRVIRKYPAETKVEQAFLAEMVKAIGGLSAAQSSEALHG